MNPVDDIKALMDEMKRTAMRPPSPPVYWVTPSQLAEIRANPNHPLRKLIGDDPAFHTEAT